MEKVIRHRAFPRIIVLICLRAVYSVFFQANITGLVKKKPLVLQWQMPGCPLHQKWGILIHLFIRALGLGREQTHQPPVTTPTPSCKQHSPYLFVWRTNSGTASGLHLLRTVDSLQLTQSGFLGTLTVPNRFLSVP